MRETAGRATLLLRKIELNIVFETLLIIIDGLKYFIANNYRQHGVLGFWGGGGKGVQKCPLVRRLSVISLRVMLWSQKILTLSIYIPTKR